MPENWRRINWFLLFIIMVLASKPNQEPYSGLHKSGNDSPGIKYFFYP